LEYKVGDLVKDVNHIMKVTKSYTNNNGVPFYLVEIVKTINTNYRGYGKPGSRFIVYKTYLESSCVKVTTTPKKNHLPWFL